MMALAIRRPPVAQEALIRHGLRDDARLFGTLRELVAVECVLGDPCLKAVKSARRGVIVVTEQRCEYGVRMTL